MLAPRTLLARLADRTRLAIVAGVVAALACAVPVFAANSFNSGNNGGAATASVSAPKPAGLAVGDVMIASISVRTDSATTLAPTLPVGATWNLIAKRITTSGNPDTQLSTYWKVADAADVATANFTFSVTPSAPAHMGIARYDDVAVTSGTPIAANVTNPTSDGASHNNPVSASSVTTTQPGSYVTAIYALDDDATLSTPTGMTPLYSNAQGTGEHGRLAAFDVSQAVAGASTNKDSTASAQVGWVAQTIALKPKPTKLGFSTSPRTGLVNGCLGPITVQTQNTAGVATNPLASTDVGLATDGPGSFFSDNACTAGSELTQGTIGTGANSFTFYYKPTANGSHTITASDNAAVLPSAQQVETVKLPQTITFAQPASPQIYGDSFDIGSATSDSSLPVTVTPSGGCSLVGTTATVTTATGDCTLTATQSGDSTYAAADNVVRTVQTDLRPITVTADAKSKGYNGSGGSDPALTSQITSGSLAFSDVLTGALSRVSGQNVGVYAINRNTLNVTNAGNYDFAYIGANFTITKKPLALDANDKSKTYGASDPGFSADLESQIIENNRSQAGISGNESCTRAAGETVPGSPYAITCAVGTLTASNYSFVAGTAGSLTITKKQLNIAANPASKTYGDADPTFTAAPLTGFVLGDTAAVVSGTAACSRTGVGTTENVGTYTNVISCATGTLLAANYSFATGAHAAFTINTRTAHATFTVADKPYDQTTAANVTGQSLSNRAPNDDTPAELDLVGTPSSANFSDFNAGTNKTVNITGSFSLSGSQAPNYTLVVDHGTADINPKPVDGSFTAADKVYDGGTAAGVTSRSVDAADVIAPDVVTLTGGSANFNSPNVGTRTATLTGAAMSNPNYTVGTIATDTANITKRNVTGHFTAADKDYDATTAATITGRSLTGKVSGDSVSLTGGTAKFNNPNPGEDKPVTGSGFNLSGSDAGNYNLASVADTTATIRRQPAGNTPPPKDVMKDAEKALGGPVQELTGLDLDNLGFAFAPEGQKNTLKVGTKKLKLFAIGGCDDPCTVDAAKTIILTTAGASAAATKKIKLKKQHLSLGKGEFGVITLKLTKKQLKALRKADKRKLVVKVTLKAGGQTVTSKKKYKLKPKRG